MNDTYTKPYTSLNPEMKAASITTEDALVSTDTYEDENGPYTVVTVTPQFDDGRRVVVIVDDVEVYREGEFV